MTDDRPRPQYGEYATPQQQAKAMGVTARPVPKPPRPETLVSAQPPVVSNPAPVPSPLVQAQPRRWDLLLSLILLGWGAANVFNSLLVSNNLATSIDAIYAPYAIGTYTVTDLTRPFGIAIAIASLVIYAATAVFTVRRLRLAKIAFFVPLIGGVVATIFSAVLMGVLMFSDPAFTAWMTAMQR